MVTEDAHKTLRAMMEVQSTRATPGTVPVTELFGFPVRAHRGIPRGTLAILSGTKLHIWSAPDRMDDMAVIDATHLGPTRAPRDNRRVVRAPRYKNGTYLSYQDAHILEDAEILAFVAPAVVVEFFDGHRSGAFVHELEV